MFQRGSTGRQDRARADDQHCYPVDDEMADQLLLPVPVNFDRYFQLVELHHKLVEQCQQEFRREASVMASSMRHFRSVKAIPSVVDSLVPLPGRHANAVPLIRLFDKPKTQTTFNFEDFGI